MKHSIIVALSLHYVIGRQNQLPWHLPADLAHFKSVTMGKPIIMGRKTYESIGKPLPGRRNIVISRRIDFEAPGCEVVASLEAAFGLVKKCEEVMVIGGAELFKIALPYIDRLYLTWVQADVDGDCYFPHIDFSEWKEVSREERPLDEKNAYPLSFVTLERTNMDALRMEQFSDQAVDIIDWGRDEEFTQYPEGARAKTLLYCPDPPKYPFLKSNHRYLFKRSSDRYKEQFWMEVFSYKLGKQMDVPVPPAFVAYDSENNQSGALIEWFLTDVETHFPGGDYCQQYIPNFDRKKGKQHNFETVAQIFGNLAKDGCFFMIDWRAYWAKIFVFDALIGNTDRHQDNWGVIRNSISQEMRISPIFDNGTSMGHEIFSKKFDSYHDEWLKKYIEKGRHHIKWKQDDVLSAGHLQLLKQFIMLYPKTQQIMLTCLKKVNEKIFKDLLDNLSAFNVPVILSLERAKFMLKLLKLRHQRLLNELER